MKKIYIYFIALLVTSFGFAQSEITITTSGGSFPGEKWVSITTAVDGGGTQIWGQGNGTQCDGSGLLTNELVMLAPGTYYVNCYDQYDDSWDGTLISVEAYGSVIGDNGGTSPTDGADTDASSACEGTPEELEASFAIIVPAPPACIEPSALTLGAVTDVSGSVSWTNDPSATLGVQFEFGASGFTPGTATFIAAGGGIGGAAGSGDTLMPETTYDFYVRSNCDTNGFSNWAGPVTFTTTCAAVAAPYTEDFSTFTTGGSAFTSENCWTGTGGAYYWESAPGTDTGSGGTGPNPSITTGNYFYTEASSGSIGQTTDLVAPPIDLSALTTPGLSFNYHMFGGQIGTLEIIVDGNSEWSLSGQQQATDTTPWGLAVVDLSAYVGLTVAVTIRATSAGTFEGDIAIDNISFYDLPACLDPTALAVDSFGETTASISWTAGGSETDWEIAVQADGTGTPGSGTATTANPYSATGLTASTAYEVYLRADCGGGDLSAWVGPVDFTTTAAAITSFPYDEDFDAGAGGWTADNTTNGSWALGAPANTIINSADSGTNAWVTSLAGNYLANDDSWVLSPPFDMSGLSAPVIELSIWYNSEFSWDGMVLQSSIDGGTSWQNVGAQGDPINWYNDGTIGGNPGGQPVGWTGRNSSGNGSGGWLAASHDLTGLGGQSSVILRVAFAADGSGQDEGVAFDTVSIYDPACPDLTALAIDSFTDTTAEISWTAGGTETDWEIAVQADGTGTPGSGTATTSNPYSATGLSGNTAYEVYVRADCGGGDLSNWVGPVDFTTACGAIVPDYTADMSTNVPDACWDEAADGEVAAGPSGLGGSLWTTGTYGVGSSNKVNLYEGNVRREWLLSPSFDLSTGGPYELNVNVAVTAYNNGAADEDMGSDDEVQLLMSTDGGTTWGNLTTWNAANEPDFTGTAYNEDLTAETGTVQFAVWASDGVTNDAEDYDFHIGEFEVREIPPCGDVSAILVSNIGTTTADIAWTNGGSETDWEVAIQAQGTGTPGSGAAVTTNPYNATGLTAQTDYEVYVRADCGGAGYGAWAGPVDFSTPCDIVSTFPFFEDFEANGDVIPDCWSQEYEVDTIDWTFDNDGDNGGVGTSNNANSGTRNALFVDSSGADDITKLVTPGMDISGMTTPELVFSHTQEDWAGDQDELSVYYKTSAGGAWTLLVAYTTDYPDWTTETIALPSASSDYYIAFEGNAKYGRGIALDDVLVWDNVPTTFTYTSGTWAPFNPMGIASSDDDVVIAAGAEVMSSDLSCNSLTVNPGAGLTIDTGVTVTTVAGTSLESSATSYSSLILDGTVVGPMTYERHINVNASTGTTTGSNDLVSAPLTGQAFNTFAAANPNILSNGAGTLYLFGPFEKNTGTYVNWANTETSTLDPGVGYRTGSTDNGSYTFTGTANNGVVTNTIVNGGTNNEEWNLIGNPYPSYMNVQDFFNHDGGSGTNISLFDGPTAAIWGYDGSALNGWTIYNLATTTASTVITPGQGFFVSSGSASATLEFTPAMRRTGSSDDFIVGRNAQLTYLTLSLVSNSNAYSTDFYFNANASEGLDVGYDAAIWGDSAPEFSIYSRLVQDDAGEAIALQALKDTDIANMTIPLGVHANQGEQITFSIHESTLPANVKVYLDDTVAYTTTLLNASDYIITPNADLSGTGRFFLRYEEDALSTIDNNLDTLDIFSLNDTNELIVSGQLENNTMLSLFDLQGRLVMTIELDSKLLQNRINVANINAGIYLATVQNSSQEKTKKVIIK